MDSRAGARLPDALRTAADVRRLLALRLRPVPTVDPRLLDLQE